MFDKLKQLMSIPKGMRLISQLGQGAERYAQLKGKSEVGAEHIMLSAMDLPDGSAKKVFEHFGVSQSDVSRAIEQQYSEALTPLGLEQQFDSLEPQEDATDKAPILFPSSPSAVELMQKLAADRAQHRPLLSAHVLSVIVSLKQGIAARAIAALDIDKADFETAIQAEISRASSTQS